ncbi:MAG TPA: type II toxin-antitoxin system HicA family toxin [Candidatus Paceibacterota bacterium]
MPRLPRIGSRQILSALFRDGFFIHHQVGSHINLRHSQKTHLHVVVPASRKVLVPKTLKTILSQSELTVDNLFL